MKKTNWFKMPLPESRDAPKFKHTEPSEVQQFLQRMKSLFEHAGIRKGKGKFWSMWMPRQSKSDLDLTLIGMSTPRQTLSRKS